MTAVLDAPVATVDFEQTLRPGFVRRSARDAIGDLARAFAALLLHGVPFNNESLTHMGKVEVAVEFGGGPYLPDFDAPVIRGIILDEIRFLPVFEGEGDVLKERGLIPFNGEVVMGLTFDQIVGYGALG